MATNDMAISSSTQTVLSTQFSSVVSATKATESATARTPSQASKAQETVRQAKVQSSEALEKIQSDLKEAVERLASAIDSSPTSTKISVDNELDRFVMQVTDKQTGEVIREIPGEAVLKIARSLENLRGLLYDKSA
jgi:flagellar protein FlaG